jgi:hypothetical protein
MGHRSAADITRKLVRHKLPINRLYQGMIALNYRQDLPMHPQKKMGHKDQRDTLPFG